MKDCDVLDRHDIETLMRLVSESMDSSGDDCEVDYLDSLLWKLSEMK